MRDSEGRGPAAGAIAPVRAIVQPLQQFLSTETLGGVLLLAATATALVWANAAGDSYADVWSRQVGRTAVSLHLDLTLRAWVNDALMAVFFLIVGLEIKRELLRGELASPRRAALPAAAALGGMAAPAAVYLALNAGQPGEHGWGIPMATDIAFAVGVLALLGPRVPLALKVFLLALAIVDDIGAIVVIAVAYTGDLEPWWLIAGVALVAGVWALARTGVRSVWPYIGLGIVAWLAVHESGVHATIAGVALGIAMPLQAHGEAGAAARDSGAPLVERLEHVLHPWTSFAVIPLFALANAGVALGGDAITDALSSRVALGAALGLMLGKPVGITVAGLLAVRAGLAALPDGVSWPQLAAVSLVAGIGFTVSLFITGLAFDDAGLRDEATIGVLGGSAVMGVLGFAVLWRTSGEAPGA
jgi:NhaA family Na+:H+ antiporter